MYSKTLAFLILTYKYARFICFSPTLTRKEGFFGPEHILNHRFSSPNKPNLDEKTKKVHRLNENQRNDMFNEIINQHKKMGKHSVTHEQHHEKREFLLLKG